MQPADFFSRNPRSILLFSAGKDSRACLELLRDFASCFTVVWVNPGDPYPETEEYMREIQKTVPYFVEVKGDQPGFVRKYGHPVDVWPVELPGTTPVFAPFTQCCGQNLWKPTMEYIARERITGVIRGQKNTDALQSSVRSGAVINGVEYFHPVETWTDEEVVSFLGEKIPDSYKRGLSSSLDCRSCTAYLAHNGPRLDELAVTFPEVHKQVQETLVTWQNRLQTALAPLNYERR